MKKYGLQKVGYFYCFTVAVCTTSELASAVSWLYTHPYLSNSPSTESVQKVQLTFWPGERLKSKMG